MSQEVSAFTVFSLNLQEFSYVSKIELVLRGDSGPTRQVQEEATERHPQRPVLNAKRVHNSNPPQEPTKKPRLLSDQERLYRPSLDLKSLFKRQVPWLSDLGREGKRERARGRVWEEHK